MGLGIHNAAVGNFYFNLRATGVGSLRLDALYNLEAANNLSKDYMLAVKPRCHYCCNEKLDKVDEVPRMLCPK
jgi:hypothetical protein